MRFAYARTGGPLLDWSGTTPPSPTRAGETRSLGDWYPDLPRGGTSNALRRYGGRIAGPQGAAIGYERNRQLGALDLPRPGAPEVVEGYESPQPGAAVVHLGGAGSSASYPWNEKYPGQTSFGTYMPEGAARSYGQAVLSADPEPPKQFDMGLVRKASALAAAYHGVKRHNGSVLWGLLWGLAAYVSPFYGLLVPAIGVAQGFGQAKVRSNPAKLKTGQYGPVYRRRKKRKRKSYAGTLRRRMLSRRRRMHGRRNPGRKRR